MSPSRMRGWFDRLARDGVVAAAIAAGVFAAPATAFAASAPSVDNASTETIVFVRHGEKPDQGLGQLDCQGLNRALALPAVIAAKFGKPAAVYAPDPGEQKEDHGKRYYYVRPLATIEPTAIQFQLPIQTPFGLSHIDDLGKAVLDSRYRGKLVVVAWEHRQIETLVRQIVTAHGGGKSDVPKWESDDYDSMYVLKVDWQDGTPSVAFHHDHEGLNGRATDCPCATLPDAPASAAH
ncbi:histidine phosphatase family protein [Paraburkholderia phosphatilytica]|uniref:histidine phosphatase family protein n=1 Tax=Paraburkholderia phosphatilytica TaxID=2282883 RepID=UPI003B838E10